tara:strand:- start:1749 stop:2213 length:465 start_codon:yes stop_codon:yes gene_type:complete
LAKPLLKIETNFSFRKLAEQIEGIIGEAITDEAKGFITETKKPIEEGSLAPLSQATINKRIAGTSDYIKLGHKPEKTNDKTPLKYTGELLKSIKLSNKGIFGGVEMREYGLNHHFGRGEPARPFLAEPGSSAMKPHEEKMVKKFAEKIKKSLMK